jgi:hypothetical protein
MALQWSFHPLVLIGSLANGPTLAAAASAQEAAQTGIVNPGIGVFLISIAAALVLTLFFRSSASRLARFATTAVGKRRIRKILSARGGNVLEDFILPGAYGGLTHIDFALLTSGGILCIQTKHYNGIVFGDPEEPQWTNVDGVTSRRFLNPVIQNEGRSRALKKIMPDVPVANLVVFTGAVQFSTQPAENVIHVRNLQNFIAKFNFGPCKIDDWDAVWLSVKAAALTDEETRKDFRAQLSFS